MTDFSEWSHESLVQFARVAYAKLEAQADELALLRHALDLLDRPESAKPKHTE
jgi:hypothetical protein